MESVVEISLILPASIHLALTRFALMALHQPTNLAWWLINPAHAVVLILPGNSSSIQNTCYDIERFLAVL